ncbi:MAG: aminopeptidase P family protein [Eubacteriales bacterium]
METGSKIESLRNMMAKEGIDACLVPGCDAHMSEYTGEHWKSRQWISGFTGSAGTAVITRDDAGLWTDGRYFIQAANQLAGSGIRLFKMGEPGVPSYEEWLAEVLPQGGCLAVDGTSFSAGAMKTMTDALSDKAATIRSDLDPVGSVWEDRPGIPKDRVFLHDVLYAGRDRREKMVEIRESMKKRGADYYLLSALEEICWLYNIRGNDIPYNPYVTSFAVIGKDTSYLFVDPDKVPEDVLGALAADGVLLSKYTEIYDFIKDIVSPASILFDPEKTNISLVHSIRPSVRKIEAEGLAAPCKAVKNDIEISNIRDCYMKDSVALVRLFKWLKDNVSEKEITEIDVDNKALEFRKELPLFVELSFGTIAAYGDHAAMMHYAPTPENQYTLKPRGFFLLDSGCQFQNGTTDITRTIALGPLTDEEKKDFTLTLKSMIALSTAKFMYGATGSKLDILARMPMWEHGLDYKCGSGHGLGYFSGVHEGPQRFSMKPNNAVLEKGMTITDEPGVYKEGMYGIRTENTLLIVEDETTQCGTFMRFEDLCFLPIDRSAILAEMLSTAERTWINRYHSQVYDKLSVYLDEEHQVWLKAETESI